MAQVLSLPQSPLMELTVQALLLQLLLVLMVQVLLLIQLLMAQVLSVQALSEDYFKWKQQHFLFHYLDSNCVV
jgi:hypothetical protein